MQLVHLVDDNTMPMYALDDWTRLPIVDASCPRRQRRFRATLVTRKSGDIVDSRLHYVLIRFGVSQELSGGYDDVGRKYLRKRA